MGAILGFLSVLLGLSSIMMAILLTRNTNILVRSEDERAKQLIDEMGKRTQQIIEEGKKTTQQMIEEGNKRTQQMIEEGNRRTQEILENMRREHEETIKYIADLIHSDSEKTRATIKEEIKK